MVDNLEAMKEPSQSWLTPHPTSQASTGETPIFRLASLAPWALVRIRLGAVDMVTVRLVTVVLSTNSVVGQRSPT